MYKIIYIGITLSDRFENIEARRGNTETYNKIIGERNKLAEHKRFCS
jgi:hypothetical protein